MSWFGRIFSREIRALRRICLAQEMRIFELAGACDDARKRASRAEIRVEALERRLLKLHLELDAAELKLQRIEIRALPETERQ